MKFRHRIYLIGLILAGSAGLSFVAMNIFASDSVSPKNLYLEGHQSYEAGNLDKALESYLGLIQQGYESADLYYNLGNVYYKMGDRGPAILWYERSLRLNPRDPDTRFNLSLARSHLKETETPILESIVFTFSQKELAVVFIVLIWLTFGLMGARWIGWVSRADAWPQAFLWTTGGLLILCATWFVTRVAWDLEPRAVVIAPPGEVRNGPGSDYAVGFTVPEGTRVVLLDQRPDWAQVGIPQEGVKGWIPRMEIELINLRKISWRRGI